MDTGAPSNLIKNTNMKFSTLFGYIAIISSAFAAPTVKRDPALQYLIVKPPSLDVQVGPAAEIIAASLDGHVFSLTSVSYK
jgi:hypothetical protein